MAALSPRSTRHPKAFLAGEDALDATVEYIWKVLLAGSLLRTYPAEDLNSVKDELKTFLSDAFEGVFPGIRIGRDLLTEEAILGFEEVVVAIIDDQQLPAPTALVEAIRQVLSRKEDRRIAAFLTELEEAVCTSSHIDEMEHDDDEDKIQFDHFGSAPQSFFREEEIDPEDVITDQLTPLVLLESQVVEIQHCWNRFISRYEQPDYAGEAVFASILDSAPSLQSLFKTPKLVAAKFIHGFDSMVANLKDSASVFNLVEQMGFQHFQLDVSVPWISIFREALLETMSAELNADLSPVAALGVQRLMSYAGGAFIFIRENYAKRLQLISRTWAIASGVTDEEAEKEEVIQEAPEDDSDEERLSKGDSEVPAASSCCARLCGQSQVAKATHRVEEESDLKAIEEGYQAIPRNFGAMFRFNAAVMGVSRQDWMYEVLDSFDAIVRCISQSARLQVECDIVSLRIAQIRGEVKFSNFKAVMLSTLRSLFPEEWGPPYEEAWNWLWSTVERLLRKELKKPRARERLLGRFLGSMEEELADKIREQVYDRFFELAPAGQEYFKQSATRLNYIADRGMELSHDLYKDPCGTVDEITALGLRHVGYSVPVELFEPFVEGWRQVLVELTSDADLVDAFHWSFRLLAQLLVRTIQQGATLVMRAISTNSGPQVRKALSYAPRKKRSLWVLNVTVGSHSISPLLVSIESGNMKAAKAMLQDLMVIRADRARYYYGLNDLFKRHPDMVGILTQTAPELLPTILDGMIWRSRTTVAGRRRVNYYLKHLLVDEEGHFATAMSSVVKLSDPNLAVHPVLETLCDILWTDLVHWRFLRSKLRLLLTTVIFLLGQSVLHHLDGSKANRIATFACRVLIYLYFMVGLIYDRSRHVYQAIKKRHLTAIGGIRVPRKWVEDWQESVSLILTVLLVVMFYMEPVIYCLQSDAGSLTENCDQAKSLQEPYQILSMMAILLQFSLIIDVATISTRLSSWVLLAGHVLPEFVMTCLACAFLILSFSCSVSASSENPEDFDNIVGSMMSFFKLAVSMYPASSFIALEDSILVLFITSCFRLIVIFFLMKLLIAQLTCEYRRIYRLMMGHARLRRMWRICEAMESIHPSRFSKFVEKLRLDDPLDFSEGDHGVSGGIQVWEAANLHPTNVETVKRLGGDPKHPFPLEEELQTEADKCRKVFHLFQKQMKLATKGASVASSMGHTTGLSNSVSTLQSSRSYV